MLKENADNTSHNSVSHKMRYHRFELFMDLIKEIDGPIRILDIGGTEAYWKMMGLNSDRIKITLLNLTSEKTSTSNILSVRGDATNLSSYKDKSFDIVFSNSVIEHLFTEMNQRKMAAEAMRVGRRYFIQTPNFYFPLEPHFLFPFFQFLPKSIRVSLINRFALGHFKRIERIDDARKLVVEIRLLTIKEMKRLFPGSKIWEEKLYGLTKSIIAHNFS